MISSAQRDLLIEVCRDNQHFVNTVQVRTRAALIDSGLIKRHNERYIPTCKGFEIARRYDEDLVKANDFASA